MPSRFVSRHGEVLEKEGGDPFCVHSDEGILEDEVVDSIADLCRKLQEGGAHCIRYVLARSVSSDMHRVSMHTSSASVEMDKVVRKAGSLSIKSIARQLSCERWEKLL